jgi:ubiquinone/menaquinone biosynthesis C-methylase UbiE
LKKEAKNFYEFRNEHMDQPNAAQIEYWNDQAGNTWAEMQPLLDLQLAPLGRRAIDALSPGPGERILDIGCGCGTTTLALAERVAPDGAVLGLDISGPMLAVARRAAAEAGHTHAGFAEQDAQTANFETPFDAAFSRFGVMFFADPPAAFANIRAALRPGGRMAFVCWRSPAENPWMMVPMQAAEPFLPPPAPTDPNAPGPFAFADPRRVRAILQSAGFAEFAITPYETPIGGLPLDQALTLALRVGPLGRALRENPQGREAAVQAVRAALATYETQGGVLIPSASWIVTARA